LVRSILLEVFTRAYSHPGPPVKFSDTKTSIRRRPPLLGEHTQEILKEIGVSESTLQELKDLKVI
jgi:succinate---hydroxymethylglutarate CoA-transferase